MWIVKRTIWLKRSLDTVVIILLIPRSAHQEKVIWGRKPCTRKAGCIQLTYGFFLELYQHHIDYIKRVVPPSRLHFFDVKEGWEPLCKILNVPIPDEPFPRGNDAKAMEDLGSMVLKRALWKWAQIFGVGVAAASVGWVYLL
jgi:hypothetical protein